MIFSKSKLMIAALLVSGISFAQGVRSLSLPIGAQYNISENTSTHSTTKVAGQDLKTDMDVTSVYQLSVDGLKGNNYDLTGTIKDIKMNLNQAGQAMSYDSKKPDSNSPLAGVMGDVLNKPQKLQITKQNVLVSDPNAKADLSSPLSEAQRRGFGSQMAFIALPADLKAGDSFNITTEDKPTATKMDLKYVVKSISGGAAEVQYAGTTNTDGVVKANGTDMNTKTTGTVSGTATVDLKTGVVQTADINSKVSGAVAVMGQEMPISVDTSSKITVTKL